MTSYELINHDIPTLKPTDSIEKAEMLLEEMQVDRLPVVNGKEFIGWFSSELAGFADIDQKIEKINFPKHYDYIPSEAHFLDALKALHIHETDMLPVCNATAEYQGIITEKNILKYIESCGFVASPGGILVLSIKYQDYSLSEIGRIIESNDMKLICLLVSNSNQSKMHLEVTLKLNKTDLSRLVASFERFGYQVIAEFHDSSLDYHDSERLELLLKYLSI